MGNSLLPLLALVFSLVSACDRSGTRPGQTTGGCKYVRTEGRCKLAAVVVAPANSDDPNVVAVRATYAWQGDTPAELRGATKLVEWTVPRGSAESAQAHARAHADLACWVAVDQGGCPPDGPQLQSGALPPPPVGP